jgi:hypothetical protein
MSGADMPLMVRVPGEADFAEGDDFLDDPALDALLLEVIGAYEALGHIEEHGISVRALWKKKGGKSRGKLVYSGTTRPSGLLAHFCGVDFVIWLAADNVELESWTPVQIRKLLYHECRRISWDEGDDEHDPKAVLVKPDLELFLGEIADTGLWNRTLDALGRDFQQADLSARSAER